MRISPLAQSSSLKETLCTCEREHAAGVDHCIYRVFDGLACLRARLNLPAAGRVTSLMRCTAVLSSARDDDLSRSARRADRFGLTTKRSVDSCSQCISRSLVLFGTPPKHAEGQLNFSKMRQTLATFHCKPANFRRLQQTSASCRKTLAGIRPCRLVGPNQCR